MLSRLANWSAPASGLQAREAASGSLTPHVRKDLFATYEVGAREQIVLAEIVLATPSLWREAATLSRMSRGPYDIGPDLLLAMFAEDEKAIRKCLDFGRRAMSASLQASGLANPHSALAAGVAVAAWDRFFHRRERRGKALNQTQLAAHFQVRAATFSELRGRCLALYRRQYLMAVESYGHASRDLAEDVKWLGGMRESNTPRNRHTVGRKHDRSPAPVPRVPPRVVGRRQIERAA